MCIAIPMRVLRMEGHTAVCEGRNGVERLDTLLTGRLQEGQWVLAFLGSVREAIDEERAAQVNGALDVLEAALQGADPARIGEFVADRFADLVGREPQLPEFLRKGNPQGEMP
jgi:hydrogenase expression/formation protein HypC